MTDAGPTAIEIGLTAAIVAVDGDEPMTLTAGDAAGLTGLPSGPFDPLAHHTFEIGLRSWVRQQTGLAVGYVEQLYTFGDRGRHAERDDHGPHVVSVGYLALTRRPESADALRATGAGFTPWYRFFPWEDWRVSRPEILDRTILPALDAWSQRETRDDPPRPLSRRERLRQCFAAGGSPWDEEKVLDRYESRRRAATTARLRWNAASCPRWASRCGSTIGGFSRPRSRACAPS
jgi:hypothetical protein